MNVRYPQWRLASRPHLLRLYVKQTKNGSERRSSIRAGNRVLCLAGHFGRTEPLDLASVARIEFE